MKVAVVGGASTYTPELVSGLVAQSDRLPITELVLHDLDEERLSVVGALAQRILNRQGYEGKLLLSTKREESFDGASAVLLQLRVGGQAARLHDETVPLDCGCIGQETTGAGGLGKALRTVPVVLDIAEEIRKRANPDAWIVDFTNPVGIVTRALLNEGHKAVGLCNVAIGLERFSAKFLNVTPDRVKVDQIGLNHLTWIRKIYLDGQDVLPEMLSKHGDEYAKQLELPRQLLDELGVLPSYYLRYYYSHDEVLAELKTEEPRASVVSKLEAELIELYKDPNLVEKPAILEKRGGAYYSEAAAALLASLVAGTGDQHVVNVRNNGTLAGLADDDVVEVPALIDTDGAHPLAQEPVQPEILGLIQHVTAYERLALKAAKSADLVDVRKALLAHPLIGQWGMATALADVVPYVPAGTLK
jgi:6-phospho-beta-glucosidase